MLKFAPLAVKALAGKELKSIDTGYWAQAGELVCHIVVWPV